MTEKPPTQGERIEQLEADVAKLEKLCAKIVKALAEGDPTLTAAALAR